METLEQFQKELTPAGAYQALLDGKVIEKNGRYFKKTYHTLKYKIKDGLWQTLGNNDEIARMFLELNGYRLAYKKVKKEVKCWVNFYDDGDFVAHENKEDAIGGSGRSAIATAVEMTGYYEVWEDEE